MLGIRKTVLYFYHHRSSFVAKDILILKKKYTVFSLDFRIKNGAQILLLWIRQFVFLLFKVYKADLIVCQFAGYHSVLPALCGKILGKPVLIIPGGIDCVSFPSINYGNFTKTILGQLTCWSYKLAKHIAPVHQSLILSNYIYQSGTPSEQGILAHCPDIKTPFTTIFNGYDSNQFLNSAKEKETSSFITIATNLDDPVRVKVKGIDLIVMAAKAFPDCMFTIIGANNRPPDYPKNIKVLPQVPNIELPKIMAKAEFYFQLSLSEGFPNALCEAMLCECIPIGSGVASIPDIIGDTGFILVKNDIELLKLQIMQALNSDKKTLAKKARQRILENFPIERREKELLKLIEGLIK